MTDRASAVIVLLSATFAVADVFSYEATAFPEDAGFSIVQIVCDPEQSLGSEGWFTQHVDLCEGFPPPGGQEGTYIRSLADFIGVQGFFAEWRVESTANANELPWGGGATLAAGGFGGVNYKCQVTSDEVELWRDNLLPIIFVPIEQGIPHTYRLELYGANSYAWLIDGQVVDTGVPEGAFPSSNPSMTWRTKAAWTASTSSWDYIRYGRIPTDASGDFDSDGDTDDEDLYFFQDCLLGPDSGGPGCRWADMNADGTANGADIRPFVDAMLAP